MTYADLTADECRELEAWFDCTRAELEATTPEPCRCTCGGEIDDENDPHATCPECGDRWNVSPEFIDNIPDTRAA